MTTDQRMALLIKFNYDLSLLKKKVGKNQQEKLNKNKLGKTIKSLGKTFNKIFVDETDISNFKNFVEKVYQIAYLLNEYGIARKIFNEYQILDVCLDNIEKLGKEYTKTLFFDIINLLFAERNLEMQGHRNIIDMCKYSYNKTGLVDFYYYMAHIIYNMCWCCYRPTNAHKTALKYYEICLTNGFVNGVIYADLIDIYYDYIFFNEQINNEEKEKSFNFFLSYWNGFNENKYNEDKAFTYRNSILYDKAIGIFIMMNKKSQLDLLIVDIYKIIESSELINLLNYYHNNYYDEFIEFFQKIKNINQVKYYCLKTDLALLQANWSEAVLSLEKLLDLSLEHTSKKDLNKSYIESTFNKFFSHYIENEEKFLLQTDIILKLVDYYLYLPNYLSTEWIKLFGIFFKKISSSTQSDDYLIEKINLIGEKNIPDNDFMFKSCEITKAKKFIDGVYSIILYLKNKSNKNQIKNLVVFLSNYNPYCRVDSSDDINFYFSNPFNPNVKSKQATILTWGTNSGVKDYGNTWCYVKGNDIDYDPIYQTYSDYYNGLYEVNKEIELEKKNLTTETNQYIQNKLNLIKNQIDE